MESISAVIVFRLMISTEERRSNLHMTAAK